MRRIGIVVALLAFGIANGEDSPDEARLRKVRELVELTGAADHADIVQWADSDAAELRKEYPRDELMALVVPIYAKRFDDETLDATLAFLRSPAGTKYAAAEKAAHRELMDAVTAWMRKKIEEALPTNEQIVRAKCKEYYDCAQSWRIMSGTKKYPETLEQMEAPLRPGESNFLEVVKDPWGHKYVLRVKDKKPTVVCFGPDGVEDTADDISYPER